MPDPLVIARSDHAIGLLPQFANRHGLITGATGTGKTVTLQVWRSDSPQSACPYSWPTSKAIWRGFPLQARLHPK